MEVTREAPGIFLSESVSWNYAEISSAFFLAASFK